MNRNFFVRSLTVTAAIVGIMGIALALASAQGQSGQRGRSEEALGKSNKADKSKFRPVVLKYVGEGNGCVDVRPPVATIWRTPNGKDKRVTGIKWIVVDSSLEDAFWEIRWDNETEGKKDDASDDYFGDIDIPCGHNMNDATPGKPSSASAKWPYKVEVWKCVDGVKSGDALCDVDPRIDWGN